MSHTDRLISVIFTHIKPSNQFTLELTIITIKVWFLEMNRQLKLTYKVYRLLLSEYQAI